MSAVQPTVLSFGTKAQTLESLQKHLSSGYVLPLVRFTVGTFQDNPAAVLSNIRHTLSETEKLIVRSSARSEDVLTTSNAGHYLSVLNVDPFEPNTLEEAIKSVISSYGKNLCNDDEVFVQPMLKNIRFCGVAFTCDLDSLAPYYIINYDETGSTDAITNGSSDASKTYVFYKYSPFDCPIPELKVIIDVARELEKLFQNISLDIEFAVTCEGDLYILQVRPIVVENKLNLSTLPLQDKLEKLHKKIHKLSMAHPNLLGEKPIYGVMPDWNPAEIIGIRPRALALSLYKELITDSIWAYQRNAYGYRNLHPNPLLVSFFGIPYIDVRVDFNSFIPKQLDERIAGKLAQYYLDQLIHTPTHHDKVEFNIVHSCYYLDLPEKLETLLSHGFNQHEIRRIEFGLLNLTNAIISPDSGLFRKDMAKVHLLNERYTKVMHSSLSLVDKIYWILEDCKCYGTLPFAGIARAAFIAIQFLQSMVSCNIITKQDHQAFLNSLSTVSKQINLDLYRVWDKTLDKQSFLDMYGHLRPGTYDILSARYDEDFEKYFSKFSYSIPHVQQSFQFSTEQLSMLDTALSEQGILINAEELIRFIREAIEGREYSKFVFTRSLSQALTLVKSFGKKVGLEENDMSFVNIKTILNLYASLDYRDVYQILMTDIMANKDAYRYTQALRLPGLITKPDDIYGFFVEAEAPNFITLKSAQAEVFVERRRSDRDDYGNNLFAGKIVFITAADPGYDFLFSKGIAGLVTLYGGANSHMAIRCAELGIPAIIGAGEKLFMEWSKATILHIDCESKHVRVVS